MISVKFACLANNLETTQSQHRQSMDTQFHAA
jgi:hypothetical protein